MEVDNEIDRKTVCVFCYVYVLAEFLKMIYSIDRELKIRDSICSIFRR